ncbi:hypothetical protein YPPY47_2406 [Yersinia pestis PY-47]|uniref:Transposase n=1 Tax=Yersinia pestis PY-08 TaxID=992134 RepID=A0AB72ZQ25_YERPE|nr:hypothetical protein YPPY03_2332 [Yersinia pestis PY-03]EIR02466.1 hypothetical protein YPPY04_2300 [Yersinia pestis PY-04]EIR04080.1 hypothetical protein YPPY05_2283 [Yersinia pestis PY-05]EIR06862.1 hypothetical protein YPPY06_2347 [Yersinia pestis PY-06]EIR18942.1 hypothetical protein YPPY08_2326 [Yersinia pestis PY-08]EIR21003.1 hypothetical protein YPPY09_2350 [Yersinia pestis PY-09]EIR34076.1 hypothetical protein YPPY11_2424 [Yersinia pestis PY-11]EIR65297.1 hypothetical protein YPP
MYSEPSAKQKNIIIMGRSIKNRMKISVISRNKAIVIKNFREHKPLLFN